MISLAPIPIAKLIAWPTAASSTSSRSIIALPLQLSAAMNYQLSSCIKTPTPNELRSLNIAPSKFILKDISCSKTHGLFGHRTICTVIWKAINFFNCTTSTLSQKVPPPPLLLSLLKFSCKFNDKKALMKRIYWLGKYVEKIYQINQSIVFNPCNSALILHWIYLKHVKW